MGQDGGTQVFSIVCVVLSSLATTFGLFFQKISLDRSHKYEHLKLEQEQQGTVSPTIGGKICTNDSTDKEQLPDKCVTRAYWVAGFFCITFISFFLDMYSMATLGQSMVVPLLASLEVAENQMFAPLVLGEQFDRVMDTAAAICCICGALCTTLFGPGGPASNAGNMPFPEGYDEAKVRFGELFSNTSFLAFEAVVIGLFLASLVVCKMERYKDLHFMAIGYIAGFLGGQQNLFLKGTGMCVVIGVGGDVSVFADWMIYVFAGLMGSIAALQLFFLNQGLDQFDALLFVPTYTILYISSGTLTGMMLYQEYQLMSLLGWFMFALGFCFIGAAMGILGWKAKHEEEQCLVEDVVRGEAIPSPSPLALPSPSAGSILSSGSGSFRSPSLTRSLSTGAGLGVAVRRVRPGGRDRGSASSLPFEIDPVPMSFTESAITEGDEDWDSPKSDKVKSFSEHSSPTKKSENGVEKSWSTNSSCLASGSSKSTVDSSTAERMDSPSSVLSILGKDEDENMEIEVGASRKRITTQASTSLQSKKLDTE